MSGLKMIEVEKRFKILVVDDERIFRNLLLRALKGCAAEVVGVGDGDEAIEKLKAEVFEVVVTDLMMPKTGGVELLQWVKRNSPSTEVIIITGYASLDSAMIAIREGAYDYITKPFQIDEVVHAVERAKEKVSLTRENRRLLNQLEEAYLQIQELINNKQGLTRQIAKVDNELSRHQQKILAGVFAIKRYQNDLAQKEYLSPLRMHDDVVDKIDNAAKLRDQGKISQDEYLRIKEKLIG